MKILYLDNDIAVCEKDYGVASQKSGGENMIDILSCEIGKEVFPVHRLDITTTGLIVYALNQKSASSLCAQVTNRTLEKEYFALVHGKVEDEGEMVDFLFHDSLKNKSFVRATKKGGAKEAKLEFRTLGRGFFEEKELSLVKIHLITGRTHQIRVQFASRSFPLFGDGKYGAKDNDKIALHSAYLSFVHPTTNKKMEFRSLPSSTACSAWGVFDFSSIEG